MGTFSSTDIGHLYWFQNLLVGHNAPLRANNGSFAAARFFQAYAGHDVIRFDY
jgi:hypothetical protein